MNFQEACEVLGLNSNFTEEELKKAYRKLCKQYHPDNFGQNNDRKYNEKMGNINNAYSFLKKYLSNNNSKKETTYYESQTESTQEEQFDLENYKQKKLDDLEFEVNLKKDDYSNILSQDIKDIIYDYMEINSVLILNFHRANTKDEVDILYDEAKKRIKEGFNKIKIKFYEEHIIEEKEIKEQINYNCTVKKFLDQLIIIKEKYSKVYLTSKRLDEVISQYEHFEDYIKLKPLLDLCKEDTLNKLKRNGFKNIEQEIDNMHIKIMEDIFGTYYQLKKRLNDLEVIVNNLNNEDIKTEYNKIKTDFIQGVPFLVVMNKLDKLNTSIKNYQMTVLKKQEFKNNEEKRKAIYTSIVDKYSSALKKCNPESGYSIIIKINETFARVLKLFKLGCEKEKEIEYFLMLDEISFEDYEKDNAIINNLQPKTSKIYLINKDKQMNLDDDKHFFWLEKEDINGKIVIYRVGTKRVDEKVISKEELEELYVPIEEIITPKNIICEYKTELTLDKTVLVLAETDGYILYTDGEKFGVRVNSDYKWSTQNDKCEKLDEDKIISLISAYLKKQIADADKKDQLYSDSSSCEPNWEPLTHKGTKK